MESSWCSSLKLAIGATSTKTNGGAVLLHPGGYMIPLGPLTMPCTWSKCSVLFMLLHGRVHTAMLLTAQVEDWMI